MDNGYLQWAIYCSTVKYFCRSSHRSQIGGKTFKNFRGGGVVRSNPSVEPNKTVSLQYYTVSIKNEQLMLYLICCRMNEF